MPFKDIIIEEQKRKRDELLNNNLVNKTQSIPNTYTDIGKSLINSGNGLGNSINAANTGIGMVNPDVMKYLAGIMQKEKEWSGGVNKIPKTEDKKTGGLLEDKYYQDFLRVQGGKGKQPEEIKSALVNTADVQPEYEDNGGMGDNISRALALIGGGMSSYGTALRGGDTSGVARNMIGTLNEIGGRKDERRMADPNSPESIEARKFMQGMLPDSPINEKLSAKQIYGISPYIKTLQEKQMAEKQLGMQERSIFLRGQPKIKGEKPLELEKKMQDAIVTTKTSRDSINRDLDSLEKLIKSKGTMELRGSHNNDINALINNLATNYTKMIDPNASVMEGDIARFKDMFNVQGLFIDNNTAIDTIKNFKGLVNNEASTRLNNYYQSVDSPEDLQALKFIKENPNDKRTPEIKKRLGIR